MEIEQKIEEQIEKGASSKKKRYDDSNMGDTLFVRSIPYDSTELSFKTFFEKFGEIQYAKLCMNK